MGTRFELILAGASKSELLAAGEAALEEIQDAERRLSAFAQDSVVGQLNRQAHRAPVRVDPEIYQLLRLCVEVSHQSEGAFDPTLGPLLDLWGFRGRPAPPDAALKAAELASRLGYRHLILDDATQSVSYGSPDLALDLGGVAKGYALEAAKASLLEDGVECALLHGGTSSCIAIGAPPGRETWELQIPFPKTARPLAQVRLKNRSLSVSAPAGRTNQIGAEELGHVIDPSSGQALQDSTLAAVIHPCATRADALATALLITRSITDEQASWLWLSSDGELQIEGPEASAFLPC